MLVAPLAHALPTPIKRCPRYAGHLTTALGIIGSVDNTYSARLHAHGCNGRVERSEWRVWTVEELGPNDTGPPSNAGGCLRVDGTRFLRKIDGHGGPRDGVVTVRETNAWIRNVGGATRAHQKWAHLIRIRSFTCPA